MVSSLSTPISSRISGELLHLIFTFLNDSPKDLYSCSLVNIEWNYFATRLLWRKPTFHSKSSLISFMNAVAVNNKAQHVRELDLERYKGNLVSLHLIERLIKFLPHLQNLSILSFDNYLQRRPNSAFLSSLFFTFPTLKRLTLTVTTCNQDLFADIAYLVRQCSHIEELKILMNFNPTSHDIRPLKRLTFLEIAGPFVDEFLFKVFLPIAPNLTRLTVVGGTFTSKYIQGISKFCRDIRSLSFIRFDDTSRIFHQVCTDLARYFPGRLTELGISLTSAREISPSLWKSLSNSVTSISLHNTRATNPSIKLLAEHIGHSLHTLRLQNISHNQRPGIRAWTAILSKCGAGLAILDISMNNRMNDRIGQLIAQYCHSLSSLSIAKTRITEDSIEPIVNSNRNHLTYLNLNGLRLNEQILRAISTHSRQLRNLHLQACGSSAETINILPLLRAIGRQLHYLDLRGRMVTSRICKGITKYCSNLQGLSICNHSRLYDEDILSLLLLRPNLQITNLHCSKCFFVKDGLSSDLMARVREHGVFGDTWWHQESKRECISSYHKLAGILD
ncbi:RNI-like protein [Basidiobolus meristosporus CBS 931.73]|uniref:RNI-like protein n=1 Tax=Basidiobolus meristosporus CBS 931.73 TaxID=1314790 RepID=A0A1Y1Z8H5_9FUNG|nr:RNI-like protein [Basidiobolus meristosporus CBS 931.73]|eukprot:ORY06307.1 RNI-like protein [Basidiobolus meristosporus CBS 931.73]